MDESTHVLYDFACSVSLSNHVATIRVYACIFAALLAELIAVARW
jgi:hypothetical protein